MGTGNPWAVNRRIRDSDISVYAFALGKLVYPRNVTKRTLYMVLLFLFCAHKAHPCATKRVGGNINPMMRCRLKAVDHLYSVLSFPCPWPSIFLVIAI